MAKRNNQKSNQRKPKARKAKAPRAVRMYDSSAVLADPRARGWDELLRDPCAAPLAHPCYAGMDTGYLIRTTNFFTPTVATATTGNLQIDNILAWTPYNLSSTTSVNYSSNLANFALPAVSQTGFNNFVTSSVVKKWRPVAACLKWIPSGAYQTRSGTVASGYSMGTIFQNADTDLFSQARSAAQRYCGNGAEAHEVRWLPTPVDENFTDVAASNVGGAGTVFFALQGVDATGNGTTATLNGTYEFTAVWEWVPSVLGATSTNVSPVPPPPFTSQQILSSIGDVGAYIFQGIRKSGMMGAAMQAGSMAVTKLLTGGVGLAGVRGGAMPMITY